MKYTLSARTSASSISWVMNTTVFFSTRFLQSSMLSSCNSIRFCGSIAPNGSSMRSMSVSIAKALARATRCCIPPESSCGYLLALSASPTNSRYSSALFAISFLFFSIPASLIPNIIFFFAVSHGNSE